MSVPEGRKEPAAVSEKTCLLMKEDLSFFPFLDDDDLFGMPCYFEPVSVKKGETLCREGDPCDYVAFIVAGRLEIKKQTEFKGKEFVVGVFSAGAMIGELCIIDSHPRPFTSVALEDSELIKMSREHFEQMLKDRPEVGVKFLKGLLFSASVRLRKSFDRMASIF